MAVGDVTFPTMLAVPGVRLSALAAGIRKADRLDLALLELPEGARVAAAFTQNAFRAAPVLVAEDHLRQGSPRYLLVNTGFANAGTGPEGLETALLCCREIARHCGVSTQSILPFSTGVIGEQLPSAPVLNALPALQAGLGENEWPRFAEAIMTTDTCPKGASIAIEVNGESLRITGVSKGAGMIRPNMATMLSFIATDARISQSLLDSLLKECLALTFNSITVDGDTSTNDAVVVIASQQGALIDESDATAVAALRNALLDVMERLATLIVRDAEGATRFISIKVGEADSHEEARRVAFTVAESPLVKTALFAGDPNWGRILAAVGRAEVSELDIGKVQILANGLSIVRDGCRDPSYTEEKGQKVFDEAEITLQILLGRGPMDAQVWTSDFSHEYVRINAEYRT